MMAEPRYTLKLSTANREPLMTKRTAPTAAADPDETLREATLPPSPQAGGSYRINPETHALELIERTQPAGSDAAPETVTQE